MRGMNTRYPIFFFLTLVCLMNSSCKKDMFDEEAYRELLQESSPFNTIDPTHQWDLTQTHTVKVRTDFSEHIKINKVRILSGNPYEDGGVEILAEGDMEQDSVETFYFLAPAVQQQFYAAVLDQRGKYHLKAFQTGDSLVSFSEDVVVPTTRLYAPSFQTFTYCFEDEYPKPSDDWDFNDLVLRINKQLSTGGDELRLSVTLVAVGTKKQMAAAIRLIGYDYDDIESVTTLNAKTFDDDFSQQRVMIESSDLLLEGIHGEAVLRLFEDAHWALVPEELADGQGVARRYYNTVVPPDGQSSQRVATSTVIYIVKFRHPKNLSQFTLNMLDPFVVEDFNSGKWEIHTAEHKTAQVLRDYGDNKTAESNHIVWALKIPSSSFRYPQEGVSIGYYREGALGGAYQEEGHSFGQWVSDQTQCQDWFYHPSYNGVY